MTAQGTILGTLQYMAPEQLEGRATDARTDIFALGAVIYEMVTGKAAFEGNRPGAASLVAAHGAGRSRTVGEGLFGERP
jgi:serine/threonine protein kinase